ncbi:MAG: hypothetical protein ACK41T_01980 [Pseudobdellovibrio sp.]
MISLWITIGLIIAAALVSTLGAYFSIIGIGALFSGALVAVCLMAGALEFAKFVLAAYLHQTWKKINPIIKTYMTFSVVTLSLITSIGVFGFLSDAYQSASAVLEGETIKLENLKKQQELITAELERINYAIEEIPESRVTKRLEARKEAEPKILNLNNKLAEGERLITQSNLNILEVKKKVGPLIYISRSLNVDIDRVVKYLILVFVSVFDPLAICLVIAATHALETRKNGVQENKVSEAKKLEDKPPVQDIPSVVNQEPETTSNLTMAKSPDKPYQKQEDSDEVIVQMNFKDEIGTPQDVSVQQTDQQDKPSKKDGTKVV